MASGHSNSPPVEEEAEPLLPSSTRAKPPKPHSPTSSSFSRGHLISPVVFSMNLASVITTTTSLDIIRHFSCRMWYLLHHSEITDPTTAQCDLPGPRKAYSISLQLLAIFYAVGIVITYGAIGHYSAIFGRKPIITVLVILSTLNSIAFISAVKAGGLFGDMLFGLWILFGIGSNSLSFGLVSNMFVVDSVDEDKRTSMLSVVEGSGIMGLVPSYWLGGYITERFHNTLLVFWVKLAIGVLTLLYTVVVLPESFSEERRHEVRHRRQSTIDESHDPPSFWRKPLKLIEVALSVFGPLKCLRPKRDRKTGKTKYGLLVMGAAQILLNTGNGFLGDVYLIYVTVLYDFKPDETGLVLTLLSAARAIVLTFGMPALMSTVRPLYVRRFAKWASVNEAESDPRAEGISQAQTIASHRFDVWVARFAILLVALVIITLGLLKDRSLVKFWFVAVCLGAPMSSTMSSTVAACVPPIRSGEAMAAIDMISSLGSLFAPLVIGAIMNSTVNGDHPQLSFFVCAGFLVASAMMLSFVRDSDWCVEPQERDSHRSPASGRAISS